MANNNCSLHSPVDIAHIGMVEITTSSLKEEASSAKIGNFYHFSAQKTLQKMRTAVKLSYLININFHPFSVHILSIQYIC
jgi:hypothetical protein